MNMNGMASSSSNTTQQRQRLRFSSASNNNKHTSLFPDRGTLGSSSSSSTSSCHEKKTHQIYLRRWIMLLFLSLLNLLSDWTCFSVAPIATLTRESLPYVDPTSLVVTFLFANGLSTFFEPMILSYLGLRGTIVAGAWLLMAGSLLKAFQIQTVRIYLGFFFVGLSQPLYQCTPALLSSSWFPDKERTMATGIALNANQLGIGCAFFFGDYLVTSIEDLAFYFNMIGVMSVVLFVCVLIWFENHPPTPPSDTARVIHGVFSWPPWRNDDDDNMSHVTTTPKFTSPLDFFKSPSTAAQESILDSNSSVITIPLSSISQQQQQTQPKDDTPLHRRPGFLHSLIAFSISAIVINTLSASMDYLLQQSNVGIIGAVFQILIMLSSLVFGRYTDHSRSYYTVILILLVFGGFALSGCGLRFHIMVCLLFVAVFIGPIMPISTEMGVDVSYPLCANTVLVLFQFVANLASACYIPIFEFFRDWGFYEYNRSWEMLILLHCCCTVYFSTFQGRYRRLEVEKRGGFGEREPLLKKDWNRGRESL